MCKQGSGTVWEDDGESLDFRTGTGASTSLSFTSSTSGRRLDATISPSNGSFTGMATSRAHWLVVHGLAKLPTAATCDGKPLKKTESDAPGFWLAGGEGDGDADHQKSNDNAVIVSAMSVVIACGSTPTAASVAITATF